MHLGIDRSSEGRDGSHSAKLGNLVSHTVVYGLGSIAASASPLVLLPLYTRRLTQGEYGALELFIVSVSVLSALIQMGVGAAVFRSLKSAVGHAARDATISSAFAIVGTASVMVVLIMLQVRGSLTTLLLGAEVPSFLVVAASVQASTLAVTTIPMALLRMDERSRVFSALNVGHALLSIAILVPMTLAFGLEGVVVGLVAESVIFALVASAVVRCEWSWRWSKKEMLGLLRFGVPLIGTSIGLMIIATADRLLLSRLVNLEAVGAYAVSYRVASALGLLLRSFQTAWAAVLFSQDESRASRLFFSKVGRYVVVTLLFGGVVLSILAPEIIGIVAPRSWNASAKDLIPILCLSFVFRGLFTSTAVGVNLQDRTEGTAIAANAGAAVQVLGGFFLIRLWGTAGAALATAAAMATVAATGTIISLRLMWIPYEWGKMLLAMMGAILWVGAARLIELHIPSDGWNISLRLGLLITFPVVLLAGKAIDLADFRRPLVSASDA